MASLRQIERPGGTIEIVIVNDGGAALPTGISDDSDGCIVRVIEQANAGPATARNTGCMMARGELLAFTDDDCRPDPHWLRALDEMVARHPGCAVGGRVENVFGDGLYSTASQLLIEFLYEYYNVGD